MSEDGSGSGSGPGPGGGGDDPAGRRRRRRRRRPGEASGLGPTPGSRSGAAARSGPGPRSGPAAAGSDTRAGGGGAGPRRRRRNRDDREGPGNREPRAARDSRGGGRARRERGRPGGAPDSNPAGSPGRTTGAPAISTLDDGWDDGADRAGAAPAPAPEPGSGRQARPGRAPRDTFDEDLHTPAPRETWGDDSAAPTPEVSLAPDLPPETADPGDPDPVSAVLDLDPDDDLGAGPRLGPGSGHGGRQGPNGHGGAGRPIANPVGVKFAAAGKIYLFDAGDAGYAVGEEVVVDTERGPRVGRIAVAALRQETSRGPLRRVLRRPNSGDARKLEQNQARAGEVLRVARELSREVGLSIKVFRAELNLGGGKATVYFSSEDKVDFRRLVRELTQRLHLRIEMRQTGVRDEAKMVGGIGSCGLELCCSTWLPAFVPVSIKNAKDQGLVLNPSKVSGQCGRLKCCLVYEQATYAELRKGLPKLGKRVITAAGEGRVVEVDVLHRRVRVSLGHGEMQTFAADEVKPMFPSQQPGPAAPGRPDEPPSS